jgi:hypothetical protein
MNPLREQFITEARELIAQAIDDLIAMEREGCERRSGLIPNMATPVGCGAH